MNYKFLLPILLLITLTVLVSGCTSDSADNSTTTTEKSSLESYENITVGGLKCQIPESYAGGGYNNNNNDDGKSVYESPDASLTIEVYTKQARYQDAVDYAAGEPGTIKKTTTVSGNEVISYDATDYNGNPYISYFFEVNGKNISIMQDGTAIDTKIVESFYNLN
jgi:hypothetical protein